MSCGVQSAKPTSDGVRCIESNTGFQADKPEEYVRFARCVEAMGTPAETEACSPASE